MTASSAASVETFRAALARCLGFRFEDDKLPQLSEVLSGRLRTTGAADAEAYCRALTPLSRELVELARLLSVSETYFLRDRDQFRALESIMRARLAAGTPQLRVLSAGCSSGEEPYSVAIMAQEVHRAGGQKLLLSVTARDLNPDVLEKARLGRYSNWSLRETPDEIRWRCFTPAGRDFVINADLRDAVTFEHCNLLDDNPALWRPHGYDVIFCRNVLMYFEPDVARAVVERLTRTLAPGGHLFLGHAETLRGLSRHYNLIHAHGTFFYQLRAGSAPAPAGEEISGETGVAAPALNAALPVDVSWFEAISHSSERIAQLEGSGVRTHATARRTPAPPAARGQHPAFDATAAASAPPLTGAIELMQAERFRDALDVLEHPAHAQRRDPDALLLKAILQVSSGDPAGAERTCDALLAADDLNAGAHYVRALCREAAGDLAAAAEQDHVAVYLDATFALPRLHLGLLARRAGDRVAARRELAAAAGLLRNEEPARIVLFGGGFGRDALMRLCRAELDACEAAA